MEKEKFRCELCYVIYTTNIKLINHKKKIHNIENDLKYFNCKYTKYVENCIILEKYFSEVYLSKFIRM